jgi:hypothetical protein
VTAAEGDPAHPADLLKIDQHGRIVQRYQAKLGSQAVMSALQDPKYDGMLILTPQDTLDKIHRDLLQAEQAGQRRGVPLSNKWAAVKQALDESRLPSRTPNGSRLPTRAEVMTQGKRTLVQPWQDMAAAGQTPQYSAPGLTTLARLRHGTAKALIVTSVAINVYFTYHDVQRFQAGEIGGGYLALKTSLRSA